jgi:tetratricopeptide (TPR) repeat protein
MRRLVCLAAVLTALFVLPRPLRADEGLDDMGRRLASLETQAGGVESSIHVPAGPPQADPDLIERRIVQAQVAYGVGRYADAALGLYDVVEKYPRHRSYPDALFFLADSLYQKGDNLSARDYFQKIAAGSPQTPHYQQALERLIELSLRLQDSSFVTEVLAKLDRLPPGSRTDSVPYVRGKYAYHIKAYDDALRFFDSISDKSSYYFQGRYFAAVTHIARGDQGAAAQILHDLIKVQARNKDDEKVLELAHMALGRLHYERDQPTDAIDHYLAIGRRSPLFDDALFEVAWVYVKAKQYDRALRALELLALANPKSAMLPDVRILEGNLRIRKAQAQGVVTGNSAEEYDKATRVFEDTSRKYDEPRKRVEEIVAAHDDPRQFFAQITGRAEQVLQVKVELPEVVLAWMRELPDVQRVLGVSKNLDEIRTDLDETTNMIERLERAVSSPSRVALFPALAESRGRAQELGQSAFTIRQELATRERVLVGKVASAGEVAQLDALRNRRAGLTKRLEAMPHSGDSFYERVRKAKAQYLELDKKAQQLDVYITSVDAELVALNKYYHDLRSDGHSRTVAEGDYTRQENELRLLAASLRKELEAIRQDILVASDEAGINQQLVDEEIATRKELADTLLAEHQGEAPIVARISAGDRPEADHIATLIAQADRVHAQTAGTMAKIDGIIDGQLVEVKSTIAEEKDRVQEYRRSLTSYDGEGSEVGGEVVAGSFDAVSKKFYEIGVRADVGLLDVSWSQKELAQQSSERLRLDYAHEKQQIENELRNLRQEDAPGTEGGAAKPAGGGGNDGSP